MDNLILVNKPAGITSHDVVDAVRRKLKTGSGKLPKVGHAGTLDPFATGLLVIGIGDATKRLGEIQGLPKTYEAVARLGATSTTGDPEGTIAEHACRPPGRDAIEQALHTFTGEILQTPPMYSAKKIRGEKLYNLARRGITVERKQVKVTVYQLQIISYEFPDLAFTTTVSSGTYLRVLAEDIGAALGCRAYLITLKRTAIGPYRLEDAIPMDFSPASRGSERG